jgi:hypothetical protein
MGEQKHVYELTFEERAGYLYARIAAETNSDAMVQEYIDAIVDHCCKNEHCKVMIDRHIPKPLTNTAAYLCMTKVADAVDGDLRLAVVADDPHERLRLEFGAQATQSKRFHVGVFGSVALAEQWLLADG